MNANTPRPERRDNALSSVTVDIETSDLAKEVTSVMSAKAFFGSVSPIFTMIRVGFPPVRVIRLRAATHTRFGDERGELRRPWASLC